MTGHATSHLGRGNGSTSDPSSTCGCDPEPHDPCCSSDRLTVRGKLDVVYPPFVAGAEGELVQVRERECQRTQLQEYDPDIDPYYWEN